MSNQKIGRAKLTVNRPQNDAQIWRIDWEKVCKSEGMELVANMMISLNELHSQTYLTRLVDKDEKENKHLSAVHSGNLSFLLRSQAGALFAAYEYFIEKLPGSQTLYGFLTKFHENHPEIREHYEKFKTACKDNRFKWVKVIRNNFAFHLNSDSDSKLTKKAIDGKYDELIQRGPEFIKIPGIQKSPSNMETRYILGDSILTKAWRIAYGDIPDSDKFDDSKTQEARAYLSQLGSSFRVWAESFIETYLRTRELIIDESTSAWSLFHDKKPGTKLLY